MKKHTKIRVFLSACIAVLASAFCGVLFSSLTAVYASAETTLSGYQTDGASVRIYEKDDEGNYVDTTRSGIRFHVEMPMDSALNNTTLIDASSTNERNGSYKFAEGFKTYTLIIPTSKLSGDLTVDTPSVMKLDTTEYWFADEEGNAESVAYVYGLPEKHYTTNLSYRGIICSVDENGNETLLAQTDIGERCMTYVAKCAYNDTSEGSFTWGSDERNTEALEKLMNYIPVYTVTYNVNGETSTEEVMWGDTPTAPEGSYNTWYDEAASEEIDVTQEMTYAVSQNITLTATTATYFTLTGAVCTTEGIKVYATLPSGVFENNTELDISAVDVEYSGSGVFNGVTSVTVVQEENSSYYRLIFALDDSGFNNGDTLTVKSSSVFYYGGVMYKLSEDYTFTYVKETTEESYEVFLGYLYNSDIASIINWEEDRDKDEEGKEYRTVRVTFAKDLLVNGDFTLSHDSVAAPAYKKSPDDTVTTFNGGYYYWNDGQHTILELSSNAYGTQAGDELFIEAGTKLSQNGGYYIFVDRMYAYLPEYSEDKCSEWVNGTSAGSFGVSEFATTATNDLADNGEIRIVTTTQWGYYDADADGVREAWMPELVGKILADCALELMPDESGVYSKAIYTAADGTEQDLRYFRYYFGENANDGKYQILALRDVLGVSAGDKVFIGSGTRFWMGQYYYTLTEDLAMYYNGSYWIVNNDGTAAGTLSAENISSTYNFTESTGTEKIRLNLNVSLFNESTGYITVESKEGTGIYLNGQLWTGVYYHGSTHMILELRDGVTHGANAFTDSILIKKGTRLWMNDVCHEFEEDIEYVFLSDTQWGLNVELGEVLPENITKAYNEGATEVRLGITSGIVGLYYGSAIIDESKGLPFVVIGGEKIMTQTAFSYGSVHNLIALREVKIGANAGDYLYIPAGSEWWTIDGKIVFPEAIYAIYTTYPTVGWLYGYDLTTNLGDLTAESFTTISNYESNEIRISVSENITETYYGQTALQGDVVLEKADGSKLKVDRGQWYGGNSGVHTGTTLLGLLGTGFAGTANGDALIIPAGTKILYGSCLGYRTITEDLVYTYVNGDWVAGDQRVTVTFTGEHVTVDGETATVKGSYSFALEVEDGYVLRSITVNGEELTINESNAYTITLTGDTTIAITAVSTASVCEVGFAVESGALVNDGKITDGSCVYVDNGSEYTFSVAIQDGYRLVSVDGATNNDDGTYTLTVTENVTVTITTVKTWTVAYTLDQSTATINGVSVTSGASLTVDEGSYTVAITANEGYAIVSVTNAVNNCDGTYTVNVTADTTVAVTTKQAIKLTAEYISAIGKYSENGLTGVRINLNETSCADLNSLSGGNYNMTMNGRVTVTLGENQSIITAGNDNYNYFGAEHGSLLEIRFDTTNLSAGDEFVIKKGTVFNHASLAYALEFTEDIVGHYTGSAWILNPTKAGELTWSSDIISSIISYSDFDSTTGEAINYTIRIYLKEELYEGSTNALCVEGSATVNGSAYSGAWRYHGNNNKIIELSEWEYKANDVLEISAGTRLYMGSSYYVTTNTLKATCSADGSHASWTWEVS